PDGGKVRPIIRWGDPVMHHELRDVTEFDESLGELIADMVATMRAASGVGLAANQVRVTLKVFVFDCPDDDDRYISGVICNPVLPLPLTEDRQLVAGAEGCLSLPGAHAEWARPDWAMASGTDNRGEAVTLEVTGI